MSSVFEVLFFFLFVAMSLLSDWVDMDVPVKWLAYNVWEAKDEKKCFLSVRMDILDQLFLKKRPIFLSTVSISTIKRKYDKWG